MRVHFADLNGNTITLPGEFHDDYDIEPAENQGDITLMVFYRKDATGQQGDEAVSLNMNQTLYTLFEHER